MLKNIVVSRINLLFAIMASCFVVIVAQLYYIQVIQHDFYTGKAHSNRTRLIRDRAQRGQITDRFGRQLATTKPSFSLFITPEDFPKEQRASIFVRLAEILNRPMEEIRGKYTSTLSPGYQPRKIAGALTHEQVVRIETQRYALPGISIQAENIRAYPHNSDMCHILGYVGEISRRQLNQERYKKYRIADVIGKAGIEKVFESDLNGEDGYRWVEVDATGRLGRTLRYPPPELAVPGSELRLSIDLDLQKACEEFLGEHNGSIIVMDPNNGDVQALVSHPGFDPNLFASGMSQEQWNGINNNPARPLFNRATQFQEPPGSVFKVITSIAGYRSGVATPETKFFCNGSYTYSKHVYHCWNRYGHGMVDLPHAMEGSCNVFYYQLGVKVGIDIISKTARDFGLGAKTGISLPNEKPGFIPDREWKKRRFDEEWWPGETISVSIGQGGVTTTPLQLACLMAMTANRGTLYRPRLVREIIGSTSRTSHEIPAEITHQLEVNKEYWDPVIEGLDRVVSGSSGTARKLRMREMSAAGKTGTAQVISSKALKKMGFLKEEETPKKYWDHNWFAGFAPVENPKIVVSLVLENGGSEGAKDKIQIAKKIFLKWYELNSEGLAGPVEPYLPFETTGSQAEERNNQ